MRGLIILIFFMSAVLTAVYFKTDYSDEKLKTKTINLEDGFYIVSPDRKMNFFCLEVWRDGDIVVGRGCVDMTCTYAGDRRIRANIALKEAWWSETKDFNYTLLDCGERK